MLSYAVIFIKKVFNAASIWKHLEHSKQLWTKDDQKKKKTENVYTIVFKKNSSQITLDKTKCWSDSGKEKWQTSTGQHFNYVWMQADGGMYEMYKMQLYMSATDMKTGVY